MDETRLAVAVVGAALGAVLGTRLQQYDRNLPAAFAVAGATLFYLAAYKIVTFAALGVAGFSLYFVTRRLWPTVHDTAITWARASGSRFAQRRRPSYGERVQQLQQDYLDRCEELRSLGLDPEFLEPLLEQQETKYLNKVRQLYGNAASPRPEGFSHADGSNDS